MLFASSYDDLLHASKLGDNMEALQEFDVFSRLDYRFHSDEKENMFLYGVIIISKIYHCVNELNTPSQHTIFKSQ